MEEAHLNAEELSRRIGIPASTIKKVRNNHDSNPTLATLSPLAKYFSLTITQLVGDEPLPKARMKGTYKIDPEKLNHVPLISWEESITWPTISNSPQFFVSTEHQYSKNAYALLVEEDDWENLARDTALLIDPTIEVDHRDFIIVHKNGQKIPTIKQALYDEGQMYLKPITQGYNITIFTPEHKVLGVVVEYRKHLKKYFCDNGIENNKG